MMAHQKQVSVLLYIVPTILVSMTHAALNPVTDTSPNTCVCATTRVNGRSAGSLSGTILITLQTGQCGRLLGDDVTADGYTWYKLVLQGQTLWVAGNYLRKNTGACPGGDLNSCPRIISRSEWGARSPKSVSYLSEPVTYAFIHHTAGHDCFDIDTCKARVRGIQNYHMDSNNWADIGYSFLVGGDGNVYEGRGWDRVGAHTYGYNDVGLAFSFMGNFMQKSPPQVQLEAAQRAIACGVSKGKIRSDYTLRGHRDMGSTECPGDVLYGIIKTWPNY